jgi:hypothetical protein
METCCTRDAREFRRAARVTAPALLLGIKPDKLVR